MKLMQLIGILLNFVPYSVLLDPSIEICEGVTNGQFVGDPSDCYHFYMCQNGVGTSANCPPGMLFDTLQNQCNFEDDVTCDAVKQPEETTTIPTTTTSAEIEGTTVDTNGLEELCRGTDPNVPSFYASNTNCEEYYICVNQKPFPMSCASGQYWNQKKLHCDDPDIVECLVTGSPIELEKCPAKGHAFFPHPEICEFFIYCDLGELSIQMCPFYYQWDSKRETCVLKHTSDCTKRSVSDVKWN